jgi:hypothetical protein
VKVPHHLVTEKMMDGAVRRMLASQRAVRREARLGLSTCHTSPRYWAEASPGGAYLAVRSYGERQNKVPTWKRGCVQGFSRKSRSRLMKLLAQCDRSATSKSLLVTLTYPRSYPTESSTYKRHLDTWFKRLQRKFPHVSAIWKLEFQLRGAPHFHLIVLGVPFLARSWLSVAWYESVGSNDERHRRAGTQVQRVNSYKRALSYASKYVAKVSTGETPEEPGRFWGVAGRRALPRHLEVTRLDKPGSCRVARFIRNLVASRTKRPKPGRFPGRWAIVRGDRAAALAAWAGHA